MILAIDVGNTNIVLGCIEDGKILNIVRIQTRIGETEAECAIKLGQLLEFYGIDPKGFDGAILSSVVPPVVRSQYAGRRSCGGQCGGYGLLRHPSHRDGYGYRHYRRRH